ncbi:PREDICTED: hsp70-binding protein 1 [Colobus angolensis palliatus]|uniref:hsp70-binding protein 1 n=1 Tax=Colobus angolensis palliatus TaxID=336983 RepID=UPI0005F3CA1E|nr:PREDICTED: hsp70-binding protein 1 [Colobus angolensis palliatus]
MGGRRAPLKRHLLSRPSRIDPSGRQSCFSGDHLLPLTRSSLLHKRPMSDEGSRGSRLPLALPPASQGCSSGGGGGGGGSSAGGSDNSRPPRNLQGLLQMAITAGSEEPDPPPEPMSEERRQWLQEAMSAAFRGQREEVEQMKSCLRVLSQPMPPTAGEAEQAADQQEREGALELLADLCENMDNAADFCQLSGMHLLVGKMVVVMVVVVMMIVVVVVTASLGLCPPLPGLVREQEAGLLQFLRLDGFSVLMRAMQQQVQKLKVKSAFLLQNLLVGHPEHKGTLCSMGMVQQLVALVRTEHSPFHEHVLGALCRYFGSLRGRGLGWGLASALRSFAPCPCPIQEELEFCEKLLQTCFSSPTDDSMDR